jgi:hypothetical protein
MASPLIANAVVTASRSRLHLYVWSLRAACGFSPLTLMEQPRVSRNASIQFVQLLCGIGEHLAGNTGKAVRAILEDLRERTSQAVESKPCDQPLLGEQTAHAIGKRGALFDQSLLQAMHRQHACCSTDLIGTKRHLRPAHRFAYRSGVIRVVLAALAIRRGELGSHDAWIVTELAQLARRMLRPRTCFHSHNARRQLRKHFEHLSSAHRLSQHRVAVLICTVHREHALCQVETDGSNLDGASSSQRLDLNPLPIWHNRCRSSRGGHSIRSTGRAGAGLLLGERRWRRTG